MKILISLKEAAMKAFPLPVTLVTCKGKDEKPNIITVTYVTGVNEEPPMVGIAVGHEKYSNRLIKEGGNFVVNIPTKELLAEIDYCGTYSGRDVSKFEKTGLTPQKSINVNAPLIKECPINLECKLVKVVSFPSHDLFVGEVVAIHIDEEFLDKNKIADFNRLSFLLTTFLDYREIGKKVGTAFKENMALMNLQQESS